jgi:hypothetical protein
MRIDTNNQNVLVRGKNGHHFIRLVNDEQLIITCSKSNFRNGTLAAFVNSRPARPIQCTKFYKRFMVTDDQSCQAKQYIVNLENDRSSFVEIACRTVESVEAYDSLSLTFTRLYDDNLPRIRNGLVLSGPNSIVAHYVNLETVSCEAIKRADEPGGGFDSIQWFTVDFRYKLDTYFSVNKIEDTLLNYTITFPLRSALVRNNSIYNCCTFKNGSMINCQAFLAFIIDPPTEIVISESDAPGPDDSSSMLTNRLTTKMAVSDVSGASRLDSTLSWSDYDNELLDVVVALPEITSSSTTTTRPRPRVKSTSTKNWSGGRKTAVKTTSKTLVKDSQAPSQTRLKNKMIATEYETSRPTAPPPSSTTTTTTVEIETTSAPEVVRVVPTTIAWYVQTTTVFTPFSFNFTMPIELNRTADEDFWQLRDTLFSPSSN